MAAAEMREEICTNLQVLGIDEYSTLEEVKKATAVSLLAQSLRLPAVQAKRCL